MREEKHIAFTHCEKVLEIPIKEIDKTIKVIFDNRKRAQNKYFKWGCKLQWKVEFSFEMVHF